MINYLLKIWRLEWRFHFLWCICNGFGVPLLNLCNFRLMLFSLRKIKMNKVQFVCHRFVHLSGGKLNVLFGLPRGGQMRIQISMGLSKVGWLVLWEMLKDHEVQGRDSENLITGPYEPKIFDPKSCGKVGKLNSNDEKELKFIVPKKSCFSLQYSPQSFWVRKGLLSLHSIAKGIQYVHVFTSWEVWGIACFFLLLLFDLLLLPIASW